MKVMKDKSGSPWNVAVLFAVSTLLLLAAACASTPAAPASAPTATTIPEADDLGHGAPGGPDQEGRELFIAKGCVACHGQNAQGTEIAPALPGHSATMVKRQVRAPVGVMPVFPPDRVSNAELNAIATYIEGIVGGHMHRMARDVGQELVNHHWMALFALEAENVAEASHHVDHIISLVSGDHLSRMKQVRQELETGNVHDAIHTIQEMLAGIEGADLSEKSMHLTLALSAIRVEDASEAEHHLGHYVALATGLDGEKGDEILDLVKAGNLQAAEHELELLLGGDTEDMHDDGGHGHEEGEAEHGHDESSSDESDEHAEGSSTPARISEPQAQIDLARTRFLEAA